MEFEEKVDWNFYTMLGDKIVMGFDGENDAKDYAMKHRFKVYAKATLKRRKIDFKNLDNWTDDYPEF